MQANGDALFKLGSSKERLMEFDEAETLLVQVVAAHQYTAQSVSVLYGTGYQSKSGRLRSKAADVSHHDGERQSK